MPKEERGVNILQNMDFEGVATVLPAERDLNGSDRSRGFDGGRLLRW